MRTPVRTGALAQAEGSRAAVRLVSPRDIHRANPQRSVAGLKECMHVHGWFNPGTVGQRQETPVRPVAAEGAILNSKPETAVG